MGDNIEQGVVVTVLVNPGDQISEGQPVTVTGTVTGVGEVMGYSLEAETIE